MCVGKRRYLCAQYCQGVTGNSVIRCVSSSLSDNLTLDTSRIVDFVEFFVDGWVTGKKLFSSLYV